MRAAIVAIVTIVLVVVAGTWAVGYRNKTSEQMKMETVARIPLEIYNTSVVLVYGCDSSIACEKLASRYNAKSLKSADIKMFDDENVSGMFYTNGKEKFIIIKKQYELGALVNITTHESTHAMIHILEKIGSKVTYETGEPAAYLTGYISGEIIKLITN